MLMTVLLVVSGVVALHRAQQQHAMMPTIHAMSAINDRPLTTTTTMNL